MGGNIGRQCLQRLLMVTPAEVGIDDGENGVPFPSDDGVCATVGLITDARNGRQMVLGHDIPESGMSEARLAADVVVTESTTANPDSEPNVQLETDPAFAFLLKAILLPVA